jgi:hypothetical protein
MESKSSYLLGEINEKIGQPRSKGIMTSCTYGDISIQKKQNNVQWLKEVLRKMFNGRSCVPNACIIHHLFPGGSVIQ